MLIIDDKASTALGGVEFGHTSYIKLHAAISLYILNLFNL